MIEGLARQSNAGSKVLARLMLPGESLHAPELLDLEVLSGLRALARRRELQPLRAELAVAKLAKLRVTRHSHAKLRDRIWSLRENLTPCDAAYLAVAERLEARLLTSDPRLARAARGTVEVELLF